jgi:hypothetical protein
MADNFRTDKFHVESVMLEFLDKEVEARVKEFDSCVMIGGRKVAANVEFKDGVVSVDVEAPVVFLDL